MTRSLEDLYAAHFDKGVAKRSLLLPNHTAAASARVTIAHAQLRHLITCPQNHGIVYYISSKSIVERDLLNPNAPPRCIVDLDFHPTCFAATAITSSSNSNTIIFAAGGYSSDIHLSLHSFPPGSHTPSSSTIPAPTSPKLVWRYASRLRGPTEIVNSILFTPASLTDDTRRPSSDMRIAISGNDAAVKFFDIGVQPALREDKRLQECGSIKLETPINHMSVSPDGRTLLCVGDTPKAYLFSISPGSTTTFSALATYMLPAPPPLLSLRSIPPSPTSPPTDFRSLACFSTAWSADGLKFAVASQEGQLCVWDVRSAKPLYTFWTEYRRNSVAAAGARGRMGEWEWEDLGGHGRLSDEATNNGPDSGIRNVRFSAGDGGRELLVFTEHTTNLHVIDARTFDPASHSVVPFPDISFGPTSPSATQPVRSASPETAFVPSFVPEERLRSRSPDREPAVFRVPSPTDGPRSPILIHRRYPRMQSRSRSRSPPPSQSAEPSPPSLPPPIFMITRSRSRSRSHSRSRVRLPTVSTVPTRSATPPRALAPDAVELEDPRGPLQLTLGGDHDGDTLTVRLDADGDVVAERDGTDPARPRWPTRHMVLPHWNSTTERSEPTALESVAEGGEPPQPRPTQLAGLCFDPSGGWVYAASEKGIVEWRVREREEGKTCWGGSAWA